MKKVLLALLMSLSAIAGFSQTDSVKIPLHRAFISVGTNWAPKLNPSYSAEVGTWGIKSNTSFSLTFDAVPNGNKITTYGGFKAYYTVHSEEKLCYMVYVAPKFALDGSGDQIIEFGFNPYYTLSNNFLLGVTLGNQVYNNSQWNIFTSAGIVYLFNKK